MCDVVTLQLHTVHHDDNLSLDLTEEYFRAASDRKLLTNLFLKQRAATLYKKGTSVTVELSQEAPRIEGVQELPTLEDGFNESTVFSYSIPYKLHFPLK